MTHHETEAIDTYLTERRRGGGSLDNFWLESIEDLDRIRLDLGLHPGRPLVVMFCNILWDSAVIGMDLAFPSMGTWVVEAIRWAEARPEVDLVIRIHPAEVKLRNHPTREGMAEHIAVNIPVLPPNVRVVEASDPISSYVLMDIATVGLVYTSTVGLELAAQGVPVVLAAETHFRGRGFTVDVDTPASCWASVNAILDSPPDAPERDRVRELARRYAVLFFFRFHHVLAAVNEEGRSRPRIKVAAAKELDRGLDPVMDRVVIGILEGIPPIAPLERRRDPVTV